MKTFGFTFSRLFLALAAFAIVLTGAFQAVTPGKAQTARTKVYVPFIVNNPVLALTNGDFEQGRTGWTESSLRNQVIIVDITSNPYKNYKLPVRSGKWIAWLGGAYNETSAISQRVTILREFPYLTYWHYIASLDSCTPSNDKDLARIMVNSNVYVTYDLCKSTSTNGWKQMFIDLTAYAGQTVVVGISVVTDGSENSNLFIDDVSFTAGPSSAAAAEVESLEASADLSGLTKDQIETLP